MPATSHIGFYYTVQWICLRASAQLTPCGPNLRSLAPSGQARLDRRLKKAVGPAGQRASGQCRGLDLMDLIEYSEISTFSNSK